MKALLSVYDKTGIEELARGLSELGWDLISSGGTSAALTAAGIDHIEVAELTGAPEMLGGRVKTLHPVIHGGILADRSKPDHLEALDKLGIGLIDLVVCNLYPFSSDPSIELIDVGGPTMVRAAAKNHDHVAVVVDPADWHARPSPTLPATTPPSWSGWTSASMPPSPSSPTPMCPPSTRPLCCPTRSTSPWNEPEAFAMGRTRTSTGPATGWPDSTRGGTTSSSTAAKNSPTSTCSTPMRPGGSSTSSRPARPS